MEVPGGERGNVQTGGGDRVSTISHVISLRGDIGWPPRSPDLTPCDFFFGATSKQRVKNNAP